MKRIDKAVARPEAPSHQRLHVETIQRTHGGRMYTQHLLRSSYREGGKVKHRTYGNLSHLPEDIIDLIRRALRGEQFVPVTSAFEIRRTLPHGHVAAVLGMARRLGLDRLLETHPSRRRDLVLAMIVSRILDPASRLAPARSLQDETRFSSLGEVLRLDEVDEDDLYNALDWLETRQAGIERKLAKRHLSEGCLVLYDLTSVACTGNHCPLAEFGYPPEQAGRKRYRQMRVGLVCTREGIPVSVEVFPGNTKDAATVQGQVEKLRQSYQVGRVALVGDRGILADIRLRKDVAPEGLDWITALRAPTIASLVKAGSIQLSLFDQRDLAEITSPDYPEERLIACRNPLLARERAEKREALLRATEKQLDEIVEATRRLRRPLRGQTRIALRVGKVINKYHMAKRFRLDISNDRFSYERDSDSIEEETALSAVEHAFRCLKTIDLKIRPLYHRLEGRVRAHAFLCMLAYYVEWHMRRALAPLLFDEEDQAAAEAQRQSVVAPAQRSPQARGKAQTKRTARGEPVHSFQTLLKDLATIAINTVVVNTNSSDIEDRPTFQNLTLPTPLQQRAFDLLGVTLK